MTFRAHNVILPDGTETLPGKPLVAETGACREALRCLEEVFGPGPHDGEITVADVGCLEGGYAAEFARAGYYVTGIEAREENYGSAITLPSALGLPNLGFLLGDARELLPGMSFDAVFCSGLLYHLDEPVKFCNLLGQVTRRLLILNTHVSMENGHPEDAHNSPAGGVVGRCLPGPVQHEGITGHWYEELEDPLGSYGNALSFWPDMAGLLASLAAAGFTDVSQRDGWRTPDTVALPHGGGGPFPDRIMLMAVKP